MLSVIFLDYQEADFVTDLTCETQQDALTLRLKLWKRCQRKRAQPRYLERDILAHNMILTVSRLIIVGLSRMLALPVTIKFWVA
jgi:hypothetical protein